MKFLKCPRCESLAFEQFSVYGVCHDCNYFEVKRYRPKRLSKKLLETRKASYQEPNPFNGNKNLFTPEDHQIVRRELLKIPEDEQRVVFGYFWKDQTKEQIAEKLGLTLVRVEKILSSAFDRLRELCLKNPRFSRSIRRGAHAA